MNGETTHRDLRTVAAVALVTAFGLLLRLPMFRTVVLGTSFPKVFWYDEAYAVFIAGRGFSDAVRLSGADTTPALFVGLLSGWMRLFGDATAALSAFPFLWNVAAVPVMYLLGAELGGRRAGFIAALLVAVDPLHVIFATEVRTYSLLFFASALSLLCLARYVRTGHLADGLGWTFSALAGFYSSYTFLLLFLPQAVFAAWPTGKRTTATKRHLALFATLLVAGYLPQILLYRRWGDFVAVHGAPSSFFLRGFGHGDATTFLTFFSSLAFGSHAFYPATLPGVLASFTAGAVVAAGLAYAAFRARGDRRARLMAGCVFGGILLAMAGRFIFAPRYYLEFLAPAAALTAVAVAGIKRPWLVFVPIACILGIAALAANRVPAAESHKYFGPVFAGAISREALPGDLVLADHFADMLFRRYPPGSAETALFFPKDGRNVTDLDDRFRWVDYDLISAADMPTLEALTAGRRRIWTVDYQPQSTSLQDPSGLKRRWLDEHFTLVEVKAFPADDASGVQKTLLLLYERR